MYRVRYCAALAMIVLVVTACGDSGGDDGAPPPPGGESEIVVIGTEFAFTPEEYAAAAGGRMMVTLNNEGSIEHNWVLLRAPVESERDVTPDDVIVEVLVQPGAADTITFTAPAAGTYQVICDIAGHLAAGMEGELVVSG